MHNSTVIVMSTDRVLAVFKTFPIKIRFRSVELKVGVETVALSGQQTLVELHARSF